MHKYIAPLSLKDWKIMDMKYMLRDSIIWEALVKKIPIVWNWLVWKVGKRSRMRIEYDHWIGSDWNFRLPGHLINSLNIQGIHFLVEVIGPMNSCIWNKCWIWENKLGLQGEEAKKWTQYVQMLEQSEIRLGRKMMR